MHRQAISYAAVSLGTALLVSCTLSSPSQPSQPATPTAASHLTLLQTTDIHDHAQGDGPMSATATLASPGPVGSYARIAAYVNAVRTTQAAAGVPVVLVDSGDWTMGTVYDLTIGTQPMATYFLDTLRYDCTTLGNHEFDYTPKGLATMLAASQAKFGFKTPIVASNMVLNGNADLAPYVGSAILPTYTETLPTGLKVGFIGLMGQDAASDAPNSAPVSFTSLSADYSQIQALVTGLRQTQGCQVVIALDHVGTDPLGYTGEDIRLAQNVTGIDVIASGHTHNPFGVLDGNAAHPVTNGTWITQVICAGCYSEYVSRLDLTWNPATNSTTVDAASNLEMTDANLAAVPGCLVRDPAAAVAVAQADAGLDFSLNPLFTSFLGTPSGNADLTKGLYATLGSADQDMRPNDINAVLSPNGMGDLCADAVRDVPNALIGKALLAAGWDGVPNDASQGTAAMALEGLGYDPTPYTVGVVPTGIIRDYFGGQSAITLANAYDVLSLGISPDATQSLPVGYPMMSVYLLGSDVQKLCALQLLSQANLTPSNYYLNLSGLSYTLDPANAYTYFKSATAAGVLQLTETAAQGGTAAAVAAMTDLAALATTPANATPQLVVDGMGGNNPFATAMIALNDQVATLSQAQIGTNLQMLGGVAQMAAADAADAGITLDTYILDNAIAAIASVSAFSPYDASCVNAAGLTPLTATARYRVAGDLYSILMLGALQSQYGVAITPYSAAYGTTTVSAANLTAALANRINLLGPGTTVQELKEWEALVLYLITPVAQGGHFTNGEITGEYLSTSTFSDFGNPSANYGAAVTTRNASYPLAQIGQLMTTLAGLE